MDLFKPIRKAVGLLAVFIFSLFEILGLPRIPDEKKAEKGRG